MIEIEDIDELHDIVITIGCYRETWRLERVLRTFRKALTLAKRDNRYLQLSSCIKSMHDHKGTLRVGWNMEVWSTDNAVEPDLPCAFLDVERAWLDEGEIHVIHCYGDVDLERTAEGTSNVIPLVS